MFTALAKAGIAVHTYDAHSFGKSEPSDSANRALIHKFEYLVSGISSLASKHRDRPIQPY